MSFSASSLRSLPFVFSLRITPQRARYFIMTAKRLTAQQALSEGLADEVYPAAELEKGLKGLIKTLYRAAPHAVAETKHFTQSILSKNMDESTNLAKDKIIEMIALPDVRAGIAAFNEGGVPSWFGKFKPARPLVLGDEQ
jgi:enoyl-CoA hydratase/carnithine racemase